MKNIYSSLPGAILPVAISVRSVLALMVIALVFLAVSAASVQAQISISALNTTYSQNFDGMGTSDLTLTDDITGSLPGFHAYREFGNTNPNNVTADDGSGSASGFKNYGPSLQLDRALGMLPSDDSGFMRIGLRLVNDTGSPIHSMQVTFTAEQWHNGGSQLAQMLEFAYRKDTSVNDMTTGFYTVIPALSFSAPDTSPIAGPVDGNAVGNRATVTATFAITVQPGEEIMLRWEMVNEPGDDHGLAIDDLSFRASGGSTAAPASISGRVVEASGQPIPRIRVMLSGGSLTEPVYAVTNAFGFYRFEDIETGEAYVVRAHSRRHQFSTPSIFVNLGDNVTGLNFVALP